MTSPVIKSCVACGLDVSQQKRVKTPEGIYYCHPCWQKQLQAHQGPAAATVQSHSRAKAEGKSNVDTPSGMHGPADTITQTPSSSPAESVVDASVSANETRSRLFDREKLKSILNANLAPDLSKHPMMRRLLGVWFVTLTFAGLVFHVFWPLLLDDRVTGVAISFFIIATSVGIGIDAAINYIPIKADEEYDPIHNGWLRWCGGALLLWIIIAPLYLFRRLSAAKAAEPVAVPSPAPADLETELRRLKQLVAEGILTEDEFTSRKRTLLGIASN